MKTVETRHGCYDAVKCGALDHHVCGSLDACPSVKANGVVCTFGTTQRVTFHEDADIEAEAAVIEDAIADEMVRAGAYLTKVAAKAAMPALDKAKVRAEVARGKNRHTVEAEAAARASGKKHGDDNRVFHDSNSAVFGH